MSVVVTLPRVIVERLRREAVRHGLTLEEYMVELLTRNLDPAERAREYIVAARELLEQARKEVKRGDARQAAEKVWGATALAVKAYASWRDGRRLASHGELWEYKRILEDELGDWVSDAWHAGQTMHVCFYEGWCSVRDVEKALKRVEKLVAEVEKRILGVK
ncbi:PaREP1 family protein [Pyrolobus fumarii]|uniref:PaREP1 family protein n=1 Tax=Pyrolobus fumarii TaxID=54252 RepID=UPI000A71C96A|nr:PaREP1 family protein [Pyrolobus fumarii]